MAESTIITGQFVRINQIPASVGERIVARVIDYLIIGLYAWGVIALTTNAQAFYLFSDTGQIIFVIVVVIPALCYSLLWETFNNGQSPGKMLLGIRVVKSDGSAPAFSSYLLRWLLYNIDFNFSGGIGVVVMLLSKRTQRLGDLAAGTMVIKEKSYKKIQVSLDEFDHLSKNYKPVFARAADLSLEQINVITKTLEMKGKGRAQHIKQLAEKIRQLLSIQQTNEGDEALLHTLVRDYQFYAMEI